MASDGARAGMRIGRLLILGLAAFLVASVGLFVVVSSLTDA